MFTYRGWVTKGLLSCRTCPQQLPVNITPFISGLNSVFTFMLQNYLKKGMFKTICKLIKLKKNDVCMLKRNNMNLSGTWTFLLYYFI